ncbi:membrane protein [[Pantoea] beijingensis]|uniref:Membrane protein n=1 Tax=[Pantoea] beijingensis TaxID=1324864 RepID=A0A443I9Z2_9GAMM|nr:MULTISPECIES: DUF1435 domain-containing protein [Erwiniaceae]RWR00919.1 membrane protein [[Pantoea] beijingensis]
MTIKQLDSAWGVLLPCALIPLIVSLELTFLQWRVLIAVALLATIGMLYHKRLRHYLLLPSCIAVAGGLVAASLHFTAH